MKIIIGVLSFLMAIQFALVEFQFHEFNQNLNMVVDIQGRTIELLHILNQKEFNVDDAD